MRLMKIATRSFLEIAMAHNLARGVFADVPYNVKIAGHVSGLGSIKHREFLQASGEMSRSEYVKFLTGAFKQIVMHSAPGAIIYACEDFRHMGELQEAAAANGLILLNLCVWVK